MEPDVQAGATPKVVGPDLVLTWLVTMPAQSGNQVDRCCVRSPVLVIVAAGSAQAARDVQSADALLAVSGVPHRIPQQLSHLPEPTAG